MFQFYPLYQLFFRTLPKKKIIIGSGDSGKSTILKQMRLIHACGFSKIERENFRVMILTNLLGSMQALLEGMHTLNLTFEDESNWVNKKFFFSL